MPSGSRHSGRRAARGYTYAAVLLAVAAIGVGLAAAGEVWHHSAQREKERELLFVGNQFRGAIASYYERTPGGSKRYPAKLEDLLQDPRFPGTQRHLRRLYADPMTGKAEWVLIPGPDGGIMGVHSPSQARAIKTASFLPRDRSFEGTSRYSEWRFFYQPLANPNFQPPPAPPPPLAPGG
jgi:type II secretory pathway pseudopilin PulG